MSKYTVELRYICEKSAGFPDSMGYNSVDDIIAKAIPKIFNFSFPIFDENYRTVLQTKILKHFYTREIAFETIGLFKLKLDTKLNEIMPYYNQLYKSELLEFDPMADMKINKTNNRTATGTTDTAGKSDSNAKNIGNTDTSSSGTNTSRSINDAASMDVYSDTPQGGLANVVDLSYLTNARKIDENSSSETNATTGDTSQTSTNVTDTATTTTTGNTNSKTIEDYIETLEGKQGTQSYSAMLNEFRNTFLNIDMMIIDELNELFFQLW